MSREKEGLVLKRKAIEYNKNNVVLEECYYITYSTFDISIEIDLRSDSTIHFYTSGGVVPRLSLDFLEKLVNDCEKFLIEKGHLKGV